MELEKFHAGDVVYVCTKSYFYIGEIECADTKYIRLSAGTIFFSDDCVNWLQDMYLPQEIFHDCILYIEYLCYYTELYNQYYAKKWF